MLIVHAVTGIGVAVTLATARPPRSREVCSAELRLTVLGLRVSVDVAGTPR
jgi:hypothetical protein